MTGPRAKMGQRLKIRQRYLAGETMQEIADDLGLHKSRVGQIIKSLGLGGNQWLLSEICLMRTWGIGREQYFAIKERFGYRPFSVYHNHRARSAKRGVPFKLTFEQWWSVWESSGVWDQKGTHRGGYVMTRILDKGAYELGNVIVRTTRENADEYNNVTKPLRRAHAIITRGKARLTRLVRGASA